MIKVYNNSGIKAKKDAAVSSRVLLFHGFKAAFRRITHKRNAYCLAGSIEKWYIRSD